LTENSSRRTMVFCNALDSTETVFNYLANKKMEVSVLNSRLNPKTRQASFEAFLEGRTKILVATDLASRGLDCSDVNHVINYDFPFTAISYLHRVGRTARCGKKGKSTSIYTADDRTLVKAIVDAHESSQTLEKTPKLSSGKEVRKEAFKIQKKLAKLQKENDPLKKFLRESLPLWKKPGPTNKTDSSS